MIASPFTGLSGRDDRCFVLWQTAKNTFVFVHPGCLEVLCNQPFPHGSAVHLGVLRAERICSNVPVWKKSHYSEFPINTTVFPYRILPHCLDLRSHIEKNLHNVLVLLRSKLLCWFRYYCLPWIITLWCCFSLSALIRVILQQMSLGSDIRTSLNCCSKDKHCQCYFVKLTTYESAKRLQCLTMQISAMCANRSRRRAAACLH